jgi:hypothetical protein
VPRAADAPTNSNLINSPSISVPKAELPKRVPRKNAIDAAREGAMEEAALPRTADERRAALDATEQREETAMRVEHAAQVERFQRRLVMEALGVRGGSSDEVRHKTTYPQPKASGISAREPTRADPVA